MTALAPLLSSADDTWNTPRWFIDRIVRALGPIGLDPCSNLTSEVHASVEYDLTLGQDGLVLPWWWGLVFLNPPYGRGIGRWMARCHEAEELVALVPSRTDARWWQDAAAACSALVLWRGRFSFLSRGSERHPAPFPSSVFYFGDRAEAFLKEFAGDGFVAKPQSARQLREAA